MRMTGDTAEHDHLKQITLAIPDCLGVDAVLSLKDGREFKGSLRGAAHDTNPLGGGAWEFGGEIRFRDNVTTTTETYDMLDVVSMLPAP